MGKRGNDTVSGLFTAVWYIHFQTLHPRAKLFDGPSTFVPKAHVRFQIMLIRAAEAAVRDSEEDLLTHESVSLGGRLHQFPILRALVDGVLDARAVVRGHGRETSLDFSFETAVQQLYHRIVSGVWCVFRAEPVVCLRVGRLKGN